MDPHPRRLHRRWDEANLDRLEEMLLGSPGQILARSMQNLNMMPMGELSRQFQDETGWMHQALAALCDRVILTVAGLPHVLKGDAV